MTMTNTTSTVPSLDMAALLGSPETNPVPETPLESALKLVTPEDAAATSFEQVKFQFRDQLNAQQLADLKRNAPVVAERMIGDYNAIIGFGAPVLQKLNDGSVELLNAQRDVEVPDAERIVNNLLRQIDGYAGKYGNKRVEGLIDDVQRFFKGAFYELKAMKRDALPIIEKINLAEEELLKMELRLKDNVNNGQKLHKLTNDVLAQVVGVLAALEEIIEVSRNDFKEVDALLTKANAQAGTEQLATVEYRGKNLTLQALRDRHTSLANGISELEKSWFDWRQQFFLGYTSAPTTLNIILVSATMQRRCQVFRTMGLPQARRAIVSWQQAEVAKAGAKMGNALADATNRMLQQSAKAAGEAVPQVAMAAQTPVVSEETIFVILDSIKAQCDGLVAADKWGRQQRARNLQVMEAGEITARGTFEESRRQLVANAVSAVREPQELAPEPVPEADIIKQLTATAS